MFITEKKLLPANNNFGLLRLIAAGLVFLSHSYDIMGISEKELLKQPTHNGYVFSTFGLIMFFTMSGFLVCKSLVTSGSIIQYGVNRFLRIWPALAACVILIILVPGLIFTTLPPAVFLTHPQTLFFLFKNISLTGTSLWLPDVFNNTSIDSSLWTIPMEVRLYLLLIPFFYIKKQHRKLCIAVLLLLILLIQILFPSDTALEKIFGHSLNMMLRFGTCFFLGVGVYLYKEKLPFRFSIWISLCSIWIISCIWSPTYYIVAGFLFVSYSLFALAFFVPVIPFMKADISYGFYLYAFPVQKCIWDVWGSQLNFFEYVSICGTCIVVIALLSWYLIEKNALKWKYTFKHLVSGSRPQPSQ
jgi:peptidoglycan/LPS O-acetylase OafA/YrhL